MPSTESSMLPAVLAKIWRREPSPHVILEQMRMDTAIRTRLPFAGRWEKHRIGGVRGLVWQ